jgi:hypothetical protein
MIPARSRESLRLRKQKAEMLTSEGLVKARSVLKAKPEGRSVLKCARSALAEHKEGAGGSGKERHHHDHPQQAQHENRVPKIRRWCPRDRPGSLAQRPELLIEQPPVKSLVEARRSRSPRAQVSPPAEAVY